MNSSIIDNTGELITHRDNTPRVDATAQIICYAVIFVISVVSDTLIFLVIGFDKKLRTKTNFLLLNLALTDWLVVVTGIPVNIINLRAGRSMIRGTLCEVTGFMNLIPFLASNFNMALIAVHRYILIVSNTRYRILFSRRNLILAVAFTWVFASLTAAPPMLGWSRYAYNTDRAHCMIEWGYVKSYLVCLQVTAFPIPFAVMCFCYYKVIQHTRASKWRLQASADRHNLLKKIRELRLTLMLLLVLVVFFLLDSPYAVLIYWEGFSGNNVPQMYGFFALMFAYSNSMCDFWIYAGVSKKFRKSFLRFLKRCKFKESIRVYPATSDFPIPSDDTSDSEPRMSAKSDRKENADVCPYITGGRRGMSFFRGDHRAVKKFSTNEDQANGFVGTNKNVFFSQRKIVE